MSDIQQKTLFASPERATPEWICEMFRKVTTESVMTKMLDMIPTGVLVLNNHRQIVYANAPILRLLDLKDVSSVLGLRPGEALQCAHVADAPSGCGTGEFCRNCGAVRAILTSQSGSPDIQECRLTNGQTDDSFDLRVWAAPFVFDGIAVTVFSMVDISHEKRRGALERIFFHDIMNTASGIRGFAELLTDAGADEMTEYRSMILSFSRMMVEELKSQQTLALAENCELTLKPVCVRSLEVLRNTVELCKQFFTAKDTSISITPSAHDVEFVTDAALLQRVLINMIKNACEASSSGETVTVSCAAPSGRVSFSVHNSNEMPRDVQLQVFQRSFSTKGTGRGLGTYSIKLLTERYLQGSVFFTSDSSGTTFMVSYPRELRTRAGRTDDS